MRPRLICTHLSLLSTRRRADSHRCTITSTVGVGSFSAFNWATSAVNRLTFSSRLSDSMPENNLFNTQQQENTKGG